MTAFLKDLSRRGRIRGTGDDRKRLLHAMTTNHVEQLEPGQGVYAFFLNAQGRILADVILLSAEDHLLLDLEPETRQKIYEHLDKFIIADDVTLEDVTSDTFEIAVEGDGAFATLAAAGAPLPDVEYSFASWDGRMVVRASETGAEGFRVIGPAAGSGQLRTALLAAGAVEATSEQWEGLRLKHGRPRYGVDILETNLVQETRQQHAVHTNKGCYLGQEIVERVRARGHVNRQLVHLRLAQGPVPPPGTKIMAGEKEAGELTSAAEWDGVVYALGYARVEHLSRPELLTAGGATIELIEH